MSAAELMGRDVVAQAALVRDGEASAPELVEAAIERLQARPDLNALVHEQFAAARAQARAVVPGERPLGGVPFLLKDLGEGEEGVPTRMGCALLADFAAPRTAWTTRHYRDAGLIICGRTNTPEFGNHGTTEPALFGPTLNPWDPAVTAGGSSGGSAAATAARLVGAASGSDGTGSIRIPASCCGLVGLKPRRGRSSSGRALDGLGVSGSLARSVRDAATLLDVISGSAPGDPHPAPPPARPLVAEVGAHPGPLRIVLADAPPFPGAVDPRVRAVAETAAGALAELGHGIESGQPTFDAEAMRHAIAVIHAVENAGIVEWVAAQIGRAPQPGELDPVTEDMAREGRELTGVDHIHAVDALHAQGRSFAESLGDADALLCPTLNVPPPAPGVLSASRGTVDAFFDAEFAVTGWTPVANASGFAAISLPLGEVDGLPVGVQLIAPAEAVLIRVAAQLEAALPWADRAPAGV